MIKHQLKHWKKNIGVKKLGLFGLCFFAVFYLLKFIVSLSFFVHMIALLPTKENYGINILVVGTDNVDGTRRSDAISVIHINKALTKVRALSIPRDTRVNIDRVGVSKINHAYAYGGVKLLQKTVSDFLSIPIHHHVVINAHGIKALIDEVGGVTVDIKHPMKYDDFAGNLHINFDPGKTHLDGERLLQYVRFRSNSKGDIGRIERQQEVSKLLFDQVFRLRSLIVSPKLMRLFFKSVQTNLSLSQMSQYLSVFLRKKDELSIQFLTVPGSVRLLGGVSYWRPDIVYLDNLISRTFVDYKPTYDDDQHKESKQNEKPFVTNHQIRRVSQQIALDNDQEWVEKNPFAIEVLNGNGTAGLASKTARFLRAKKMVVTKVSNSQSFNYADTLIVDWKGNVEKSLKLAKLLNIKPSNIVVYDRQDKPLDITLVLGKNWTTAYLEGLYEK